MTTESQWSPHVAVQVRAVQVRALRDDATTNDYIDRSMQTLGMRQYERKMEHILYVVGKGARAMTDFLKQLGALTGILVEASRYLDSRLTRTDICRNERAVTMQVARAG